MKVRVTGGSGYIGSRTCKALAQAMNLRFMTTFPWGSQPSAMGKILSRETSLTEKACEPLCKSTSRMALSTLPPFPR